MRMENRFEIIQQVFLNTSAPRSNWKLNSEVWTPENMRTSICNWGSSVLAVLSQTLVLSLLHTCEWSQLKHQLTHLSCFYCVDRNMQSTDTLVMLAVMFWFFFLNHLFYISCRQSVLIYIKWAKNTERQCFCTTLATMTNLILPLEKTFGNTKFFRLGFSHGDDHWHLTWPMSLHFSKNVFFIFHVDIIFIL